MIREVRVHLALPEQGLFKQATSKAKAAITLSLRQGYSLRPEQVTGIQRLVAAAVPGMAQQDVTIVDQQGLALTRPAGEGESSTTSSARLDLKKETEDYLARKVLAVLERSFGAGQALDELQQAYLLRSMEALRLLGARIDPARHRHIVHYLTALQTQIAELRARIVEQRQACTTARAACNTQSHKVERLEEHRDGSRKRYAAAVASREYAAADRDWLAASHGKAGSGKC